MVAGRSLRVAGNDHRDRGLSNPAAPRRGARARPGLPGPCDHSDDVIPGPSVHPVEPRLALPPSDLPWSRRDACGPLQSAPPFRTPATRPPPPGGLLEGSGRSLSVAGNDHRDRGASNPGAPRRGATGRLAHPLEPPRVLPSDSDGTSHPLDAAATTCRVATGYRLHELYGALSCGSRVDGSDVAF